MAEDWRLVERDAFAVEHGALDIRSAVAGALATTAPLAVGLAVDRPEAGLLTALGGLNVALGMAPGPLRRQLFWGAIVLVGGAVAAGIGTLAQDRAWLLVLTTLVLTGGLALLWSRGRAGALAGFAISAVYVIVSGLPAAWTEAGARVVEIAVGGTIGLALMAASRIGLPSNAQADDLPQGVQGAAGASAGLHPDIVRHAVRVGLSTSLATALYRALGLTFGYWIPLTALAVLQPDGHQSRVRMVQRATGTLIGAALVAVVATVTDQVWVLAALVGVSSFALFALRERSYHWLVILLTPTALLMISTLEFSGWDIAMTRIVNTGVGLAVAAVATLVWRQRITR